MKNIILFTSLVTAFSMSANANLALECKGKEKDSKVMMSVLDLSARKIVEGQKNPVAIRIVESVVNARGFKDQAIIFAGVVNGSTEDVQWFLTSQDRKSLSGTIYMDEYDDVTIKVGAREIRLDCAN